MRLLVLLLVLLPQMSWGQKVVQPDDLILRVEIESIGSTPYQQEMVLLTIHGIYKRHITLEKLEMPDLTGTNWMQLGHDHWFESTVDGLKVKNMRRRMALFPEKVGRLTIGPFIHHLTLLDENDDWFEYDIQSEPITLDVQEAPQQEDWWFPVRNLEISDTWSNAPDQLGEGDGVLRIITLTAVGVGPDMMPPMPELTSPSAHIFAHPEKKLVELSPSGPVSRAFWRWTIKPKNPPSSILEPIEFSYFNTEERSFKTATISAQRVAISADELPPPSETAMQKPVTLNRTLAWVLTLGTFAVGTALALGRNRRFSLERLKKGYQQIKLKFLLSRACRTGHAAEMRRISHALDRSREENATRQSLLDDLESHIFARSPKMFEPIAYYRKFCETL